MPSRKSTTNQPLTGELISVKGKKGSAVPSVQGYADELFKFEQSTFGTRLQLWAGYIRAHYNTAGDFSDLAKRVRLLAINDMVSRYGPKDKIGGKLTSETGIKNWPEPMVAEWASRWEGTISIMNRVERSLQASGKATILELLESSGGFASKIRALSTSGRGPKTRKQVPPPSAVIVGPAAEAKSGTDADAMADGADATATNPQSLKDAQRLQGMLTFQKAIEGCPEDYVMALLSSMAVRLLKSDNPEWSKLAKTIQKAIASDKFALTTSKMEDQAGEPDSDEPDADAQITEGKAEKKAA